MISIRKRSFNYKKYNGVIGLLIIWEIIATIFEINNPETSHIIFPSLHYIVAHSIPGFATFWGMQSLIFGAKYSYLEAFKVLLLHSGITILRVLSGLIVGVLLGSGIGLLMGSVRFIRNLIEWPLQFARMIPPLALIPLFLVWFGGREIGIFIYITFSIFVMIVVNTIQAIKNVPHKYIKYAYTMGANKYQLYRTIIIPAIIPEITGGIRVAVGVSWAIGLAGEYLAAQSGLGRLMILSEQFTYTGRMFVIAVLFMFYNVIINNLVILFSNYVTRWQEKYSPVQ